MGVGAVVHARHVSAGEEECGDSGCRGQSDGDDHSAAAEPQHEREEERPQQVELLLDGEGPEVSEQLRCRGIERSAPEIRRPGGDGEPVVRERRCSRELAAQAHEDVPADHPGEGRADEDHDPDGGQEPAGTTAPELQKTDAAVLVVLPDEKGRDEEP